MAGSIPDWVRSAESCERRLTLRNEHLSGEPRRLRAASEQEATAGARGTRVASVGQVRPERASGLVRKGIATALGARLGEADLLSVSPLAGAERCAAVIGWRSRQPARLGIRDSAGGSGPGVWSSGRGQRRTACAGRSATIRGSPRAAGRAGCSGTVAQGAESRAGGGHAWADGELQGAAARGGGAWMSHARRVSACCATSWRAPSGAEPAGPSPSRARIASLSALRPPRDTAARRTRRAARANAAVLPRLGRPR
jgi:hypothetical protein